jgi:hypothetical protein
MKNDLRTECDKLAKGLRTYKDAAAHERALAERWNESDDPDAGDRARAALARAADADDAAEHIEFFIRIFQGWRAQLDRK